MNNSDYMIFSFFTILSVSFSADQKATVIPFSWKYFAHIDLMNGPKNDSKLIVISQMGPFGIRYIRRTGHLPGR